MVANQVHMVASKRVGGGQYKGAALSCPIHLKRKRGGATPGFPV
jgi:hypothetical protein